MSKLALLTMLLVGLGSPIATTCYGGEVTSFTVINAESNQEIGELKAQATINRSNSISLRADVAGDVRSVRFTLDGKIIQTESTAPFSVSGDTNSNYNAWNIAAGQHKLTATPFPQPGAKGEPGKSLSVTFTIKGSPRNVIAKKNEPVKLTPIEPAQTIKPGSVEVTGERKKWHKLTIAFGGPPSSETHTPNPFTDYRLNVVFRNGDKRYVVPGYYAADGDAANTGAAAGNVWLVHFAPDEVGQWNWQASFRSGRDIAVTDDRDAGDPETLIDGKSGSFSIAATDKTGRDFRRRGRLDYVGKRYLQFAETGEWFLKCGADAPENFLAYEDFDNTPNHGQRRKSWQPHVRDWKTGDPTWGDDKGKGMIGALNYLASEGLNVFSFMPFTIQGDDKNVFPYVTENGPFTRFDCSKLAQWEVVFEHADQLGLYLHFKTLETENELVLDGGDLGPQRIMYYRELIARYGHHLALNWNLGEEINNATTAQKAAWSKYFWDHDPYRHHIVIHNGANHFDLLGDKSHVTGFSLQTNKPDFANVHQQTLNYIQRSKAAGKPWVVACDEPGDASHSLRPDNDAGNSHVDGRKNGLWGNVMAGGAGLEWYFGYKHAQSDLTCQDYRSRDRWWDTCRYMLEFFEHNDIPFWEMQNDNAKSSAKDDYCFYKPAEVYVVYLKQGGSTKLDLSDAAGEFSVQWYDPRGGGELKTVEVASVAGQGQRELGPPPSDGSEDWVILVRKKAAAR